MTSDLADDTRALLLESVDQQFREIATRLTADIAAAKMSDVPEGFVLYHLRNLQGEPLKDTQTQSNAITMDDLISIDGYTVLRMSAEDLNVGVRIDQHFYSSHPHQARLFRILVDGW